MFKRKKADNTEKNRILKEASYLDGLSDLAIERHMNLFIQSANKHHVAAASSDEIATVICKALIKDLEYEIWQRIAPKVLERVNGLKQLALDATGENRIPDSDKQE